MIDHHDTTGGPFFDEAWRNHFATMPPLFRALFKGGGKAPKAPPPVKLPKTPEFKMPEIKQLTAADLPPPPVPAPQQQLTTDQGQAEDDARSSALRRRGLAAGSTIFAGAQAYKPKRLGGTGTGTLG